MPVTQARAPAVDSRLLRPSPGGLLGILMLDTQFERQLGDVGYPDTFAQLGIPAQRFVVPGASPRRVVQQADSALVAPFVAAAVQAQQAGATMITTSCGFLALFQQALQAAVEVPVLTSALQWLAPLQSSCVQCGVLTMDGETLGQSHLAAVGAQLSTPIEGVAPGCGFQRRILGNQAGAVSLDDCADVVAAAQRLLLRCPQVQCLVLECTNMAPHVQSVREATGRRVEHLVSLIQSRWKPSL